jgi:hypothetical protein
VDSLHKLAHGALVIVNVTIRNRRSAEALSLTERNEQTA